MSRWFALLVVFAAPCVIAQEEQKSKEKKPGFMDRAREAIRTLPVPGNIGNATGKPSSGKCKALRDWLFLLTKENPDPNFFRTRSALQEQVPNLFRDEVFQPVFRKTFSQMPEKERLEHHHEIGGCHSRFQGAEQQTYNQLVIVVASRFLAGQGQGSYEGTLAELKERGELASWVRETAVRIDKIPATVEGFAELEGIIRKGKTELVKLWPREQKAFVTLPSLPARQRLIARTLLEGAAASAQSEAGRGLDGLKQIVALRNSHDKYLIALTAARQPVDDLMNQFEAASTAAAAAAVSQEQTRLRGFSSGIEGVLAINEWRASFLAAMGKYAKGPEAQALLADATQRRRKALVDGLSEFRPVAAAHPKPALKGMNAVQLIDALAPHGRDATPAEDVAPYVTLLYTRLEPSSFGLAAVRPFKAAPDKTPCDDLAAHPQDPGRKAEGVADDDIDVDEAIDACEAALAKAPTVGRLHFQLGRAYWVDSDYDSAIESFLKAEQLLYTPAYFYLAEAYKEGLVGEEPADPEFAKKLYQMAGAAGFQPATLAFLGAESKISAGEPAYKSFKRPDLTLALVVGDPSQFKADRYHALSYLLGMQDWLNVEEHDLDPVCPTKVASVLGGRIEDEIARIAPRQGLDRAFVDLMRAAERQLHDGAEKTDPSFYQMGVDDMSVIVSDYGGCSGQAFAKAYETLKAAAR